MKKRMRFAEHGGQARVLAFVAFRVVRPVLWLILTLGSIFMLPIQQFARTQSLMPVLNNGYSPASMNTSNLPQSQVTYYDKNFVANLKANTPYLRCCSRRELPEQSGNQHMLFMYKTMSANTVQAAEGVVGAGSTVQVVNNTSTIGQIADYVNVSDLAMATAIDNGALENIHKELAYRFALSISTMVKNTADGANTIDSKVSGQSLAYNVAFSRAAITSATQSLAGQNVKAFSQGRFAGVIHPFIVGDALNDTTNNGITDILKRTPQGQEKLSELPSPDGDEVQVLEWGGVTFHQSTLVTTTADYQSQSGKTALRTYILGEDAVIAISLGAKEKAQIGDGDWRNLKLWVMRAGEPSVGDPSRMIGGWTAYNAKFTVTLPPDPTMRLRYIDAVSNIS